MPLVGSAKMTPSPSTQLLHSEPPSCRPHLLSITLFRYQVNALHLPKVRGVAQHVDIHELSYIARPVHRVLRAEELP